MKAAIFDLDGTLIDSMRMWRSLGRNFLERRGFSITKKVAEEMTTMSLKMNSHYLKEKYNLKESTDEIYKEFKDIILNFYLNEVEEKEEAFNTIKKYKEKGYNTILGTATSDEFVYPILERFKISEYFDMVQTCDMAGIKKSDKNYFNLISEKLDLNTKEIFLFDDAPFALKAAKEAGIVTVGVYDDESKEYWNKIVEKNNYAIKTFKEWDVYESSNILL